MCSAGPHVVTVQLGLTAEGLATDHLAAHQAHTGRPTLLPHGPRAREVGDVVDKLGVVRWKTDQFGNCGGEIHFTGSQLHIWMAGPGPGQPECEGGVKKVFW